MQVSPPPLGGGPALRRLETVDPALRRLETSLDELTSLCRRVLASVPSGQRDAAAAAMAGAVRDCTDAVEHHDYFTRYLCGHSAPPAPRDHEILETRRPVALALLFMHLLVLAGAAP